VGRGQEGHHIPYLEVLDTNKEINSLLYLQIEVAREVVKRKAGGRVKADFALFPSKEMTKVSCSIRTLLSVIFKSKHELQKDKIVAE
jgi:hypothetical protein